MKTKSCSHGRGVDSFLVQHGADVTGVIAGYDRVRLRGSLRYLYQPSFMFRYLCAAGVRLKDFAGFASGLTNRVCAATVAFAAKHGRLENREHAKDEEAHRLVLHLGQGRCLHHYFYFQHAEFGLMHLRLQTWFPFQLVVCLNGRLWLARSLDHAGTDYVQRDNSFVWLADPARAQTLADRQLRVNWPAKLEPLGQAMSSPRRGDLSADGARLLLESGSDGVRHGRAVQVTGRTCPDLSSARQPRGPGEDGVSDAVESLENGRLPALRCGGWLNQAAARRSKRERGEGAAARMTAVRV